MHPLLARPVTFDQTLTNASHVFFSFKVMDKLAKDITNSDNDFRTLRSKLVIEKENEKTMPCEKDEQPSTSKVSYPNPLKVAQLLGCM